MMNIRRYSFIIFVLLASSQLCKAQSDSLVIHFRSGAKQSIPLSQIKRITFDTVKAGVKEYTQKKWAASYPNPTMGESRFAFFVESSGETTIEIINVEGVNVWKAKQFLSKGLQNIFWDGMNNLGFPAPPGAYTARVRIREKQNIYKIILLKP